MPDVRFYARTALDELNSDEWPFVNLPETPTTHDSLTYDEMQNSRWVKRC
jgi:hypothetical protein